MVSVKKRKPKFNPRPKIDYPPVPTKKWIPPDKRPRKKPEPKYVKPKGISQKLKISTLKKVWHQYEVIGENKDCLLLGNFAQTHKRFSFKTNGYQGPCNCAVACAFARLYQMATWTSQHLDKILTIGDHLYVRSTQQPDRCWIEIPPEKVFSHFFLGNNKIALSVDEAPRIRDILTSVTQAKAIRLIADAVERFFLSNASGMYNIRDKYVAIWRQDDIYYFFDPTEHTETGERFVGKPGDGVAIVVRCKSAQALAARLYSSFIIDSPNIPFEIIQSGVARIVKLNVVPPETFEELAPIDASLLIGVSDEPPPEIPVRKSTEVLLEKYVQQPTEAEPEAVKLQEISPDVDEVSLSKRPSWLQQQEGPVEKNDVCYYAIPVRPDLTAITYYNELIPDEMGILRASTCQTDRNFSKYAGRQSMGNAVSALAMLRVTKSTLWVPRIVDTILRYGDMLYNEAMKTIPRTQSLKLSDFQRPMDYENKKLEPKIDQYAVVGKLESQDHNIVDLEPALEEFLVDNDCCVILGPQILAVWVEGNHYYMFDPNERDNKGRTIAKNVVVNENILDLEEIPGVACVTWYQKLKDLVENYVENCEKEKRADRFFLSKVQINDYIEKPPDWNNFKGVCLGKWILRGTFSQDSNRFPEESRGFQASANCVSALTMNAYTPVQNWTIGTIDEILRDGDEDYRESIEVLKEEARFVTKRLMLCELKTEFHFEDKIAKIEVDECIVNGVINPKQASTHLPDLKSAIEEFFRDYDNAVLTVRNLAFAVWKSQGAFFCFDSYSRDEEGLPIAFGTSCALRFLDPDDLAHYIETNLKSKKEDIFNISRIKITLYDMGAGGVQVPLNHYTRLSGNSAILRAVTSEDSEKYGINAGLQTIPMCLSAVTFNKLKPSADWTKTDLEDVLNKGDKHYLDSMVKIKSDAERQLLEAEAELEAGSISATRSAEGTPAKSPVQSGARRSAPVSGTPIPANTAKTNTDVADKKAGAAPQQPQVPIIESTPTSGDEPDEGEQRPDEIPITSDNVKNDIYIGPNMFTISFEVTGEGSIAENLKTAIKEYMDQATDDEECSHEVLLETKHYKVVMWRDEHVFYVFDPKPRDKYGCVFGKDDWPEEPPPPPPEVVAVEGEDGEKGESKVDFEDAGEDEEKEEGTTELDEDKGAGEEEPLGAPDYAAEDTEAEAKPMVMGHGEGEEGGGEDLEIHEELPRLTKSASYWKEQERMNGRACVLWFQNPEDLINFIYTNIPTEERFEGSFTLKHVKINDQLKLKDKLLPEDERNDVYAGNWYSFNEIEHGRWILSGFINLFDPMFPPINRGKQLVPTAAVALACVFAFGMPCFHQRCVDSIVIYGDKLHTFIKRQRKKQLMQDAKNNLQEGEIDWLISHEEVEIQDLVKKICIFRFLVEFNVEQEFISGDIKAQSFEEVLDVKRGLEKFFEENRYGILTAKGMSVAIWRGETIYFMFDGLNRGPNGVKSVNGTACLTRFMDVEKLANVFLQNLPSVGKNTFYIHKVTMARDVCPRLKEPKKTVPKKVRASAGHKDVIPGKTIVRGTFSQEDPKFGRGPNAMSAPIAIIALTMSLIHKPETWSRPIVDEVIVIGSELYDESAENLAFDFNPWDRPMEIYSVKSDYRVGVLKANCELRHMDQKGIIDTRDPDIKNIRQGIENFFQENTHGIIVTEPLTVAIWEETEADGEGIIYMFDPNPRSQTGMPLFTGTACLLSFVNSEMAAEHFIGCILDPEKKEGEFRIVPVEIIVGTSSTKKRLKRIPTRSSLPRCSKLVASETKKKLRKAAEEERRRKEERRIQAIGRNGYSTIRGTSEAILRGYRSPNSEIYCEASRGNQDIPFCIVALVMHTMIPIDAWNYKHIDLVLDTGDQLYVDSYIAYGPRNPKLGMENVVRKFFLKNLEVHVTVYKPIITSVFTVKNCEMILSAYFQQETFCILNYVKLWVAIIFKSGYYYVFDPHDRDVEGNYVRDEIGTAVVVRFENLNSLALKLYNNLIEDVTDETCDFTLWLISVVTRG